MICCGRLLAVSFPVKRPLICYNHHGGNSRFHRFNSNWRYRASEPDSSCFAPSIDAESADKKVRRLRIQQRIKNAELGIFNEEKENELPSFPSSIPFLPPLGAANLKVYHATCFFLVAEIILFCGLLAPSVDPIASFSGGAFGVISALMVVEVNNVKQQEHKRCKYYLGTGYLACARCSSTGALVLIEPVSTFSGGDQPLSASKTERCSNCSESGKNGNGK